MIIYCKQYKNVYNAINYINIIIVITGCPKVEDDFTTLSAEENY